MGDQEHATRRDATRRDAIDAVSRDALRCELRRGHLDDLSSSQSAQRGDLLQQRAALGDVVSLVQLETARLEPRLLLVALRLWAVCGVVSREQGGVWCAVCGVWCAVCGVQCVVCVVRCAGRASVRSSRSATATRARHQRRAMGADAASVSRLRLCCTECCSPTEYTKSSW